LTSIITCDIPERSVTKSVLRRAARIAATVLLTTTAVVGGVAGPAYASGWTHSDNMEPFWGITPESRFFFEADNENEVGYFDNHQWSWGTHSGSYVAHLSNYWGLGTWVAVGKTLRVTPKANGHPTRCRFDAWMYANRNDKFNIEVIDPATWNYIAVTHFTQPANAWSQGFTGWFTVPVDSVVLRVAYLPPSFGGAGFVDDFTLSCTY
jgi:hypothetical protein